MATAVAHGACRIAVSDNGRDPAGKRRPVFDSFFTTRREEGGTGMGLEIVRNPLQAHGGEIVLVNAGSATCFLMTFWPTDS